jgi:hypothetical protein
MAGPLLDFREILERRGVDLRTTRLVRHDKKALAEHRKSPALLAHFVAAQAADKDPYKNARQVFQFLPETADGPLSGALLVAAHSIGESWRFGDGSRPFPGYRTDSIYPPFPEDIVYDLIPLPGFDDLFERLVIGWKAPIAWSQWAGGKASAKPVLELRRNAAEPPFPGFLDFHETVEQVPLLPHAWQVALASVGGVYLLTCMRTGEQYVGSASGADGFLGRWLAYAANGHGGNKLLKTRAPARYKVSVLEVYGPGAALSDILGRESAWKRKLGSLAHGLNAN